MRLRDFFSADAVSLDLQAESKAAALTSIVSLLHADADVTDNLRILLERREQLGSTGVGRGIAIPHCRAAVIPTLRLAYGRLPSGVSYGAIDGQPVFNLFLIVAPPVEVSNVYLPVLGRVAQFAKAADVPERLAGLTTVDEFFALLDERGA